MDLFLKIIGGLTLAVVLLIALFLFFLWAKLRRIAKGIAASVPTPSTIDLTPEADSPWTGKDPAAHELAALEACGYVRGPAYTVVGLPGISLVSLHHPATGTYGCYYEHAVAGNWTDLCARFADGIELTVGNPPHGGKLDTRPGTKKILLQGKTAAELHALVLEQIAGRALKPYAPENFKAEFCAAYARDMAWRNAKDGTSEEEFLRLAADRKNLTPGQLKEAFKITKRKELGRWSGEILGAFEKSTTLSVAEWKQYENNMVIFRDSFHPAAYLDYLTGVVTLKDGEEERYQQALDGGLSLQGLLTRIAADTGHEFVKLGEVPEPRPTAIYGVKLHGE
jgi:hypothetical protein